MIGFGKAIPQDLKIVFLIKINTKIRQKIF